MLPDWVIYRHKPHTHTHTHTHTQNGNLTVIISSVQFSSVAQSCQTL